MRSIDVVSGALVSLVLLLEGCAAVAPSSAASNLTAETRSYPSADIVATVAHTDSAWDVLVSDGRGNELARLLGNLPGEANVYSGDRTLVLHTTGDFFSADEVVNAALLLSGGRSIYGPSAAITSGLPDEGVRAARAALAGKCHTFDSEDGECAFHIEDCAAAAGGCLIFEMICLDGREEYNQHCDAT